MDRNSLGTKRQRIFLGGNVIGANPIEGMQQAKQLAWTLRAYPIRSIFSSDLLRAEQIALKIAAIQPCQLERIKELREVSLGEWEGRRFSEIRRSMQQALIS